MAFNVSIIFRAVDQFSAVSKKMTHQIKKQKEEFNKVSEAVEKAKVKFKEMSAQARKTGAIMTAAVTVPMLIMAKKAIDAASNAEETQSKFNEVFSSMRSEANKTASDFASSFGVANSTAQEMISNTGDILSGLKFTQKESLKLSVQIAQLGSDLTSFKNFQGGAAQASTILTKALLGERDSLVSLGLKISEEEVKAKELMLAQQGQRFASERQAKAQATLALVMERSQNAIGDTQRTWDSYANSSRRVQEQQKQLAETWGRLLLPVAGKINSMLSEMLDFLESLSPGTQKLIIGFAAFAAILGPILVLLGSISLVIGAISLPVLAIVAAVGALAAGLVFLKKNWIEVSDAIGGTIEQIQINFENSIVGKLFDKIGSLAGGGESKIALDINVNDKAGNVDNIESSSATAPGVSLNVGQNMGMAL